MFLQFVKNSATFRSFQPLSPAESVFKILYYINELIDILMGISDWHIYCFFIKDCCRYKSGG